ncbi:AsnC family transcriptional regulator [Agromyces mangrovi Wang et al. 2018]|nr:AsnC family transcriptional regulator [Agromyces mangrovi]
MRSMDEIDPLDARILLALDDEPDATILTLSRRLGIARNTAHARLRRLADRGVLGATSRRIDPAALGLKLTAFISLEARQADAPATESALVQIPEVVEVHSTTGDADYLLKVVARDTSDLRRITADILAIDGVERSGTVISLDEVMGPRVSALLERVAAG